MQTTIKKINSLLGKSSTQGQLKQVAQDLVQAGF